ncbi:MAG: hypothetical protein NVS3B3_04850 [Aquirhabdus sp.]
MSDSNKKPYFRSRGQAISAIELQIRWWRSPKLTMAGFVAIAGLMGFIVSTALLKSGVQSMPIRYAAGLFAGYLSLCLSLWLWAGAYPKNIAAIDSSAARDDGFGPRKKSSTNQTADDLSTIDIPSSVFELKLIILLVLFGVAFWLISSAPTLMAELTLDSLVSMQVYHRIRRSDKQPYLLTFWQVTRFPLLLTVFILVGGAWLLQTFVPEAHTLWQALKITVST